MMLSTLWIQILLLWGEINESIDSMCERIKTITDARDNTTFYPKLMKKIHGRWSKLNTPLHVVAY